MFALLNLLTWLLRIVLLFAIVASTASIDDDDDSVAEIAKFICISSSLVLIVRNATKKRKASSPPPSPPCKRFRKNVRSIFAELGKGYVQQAYHMHEKSFWELYKLLKDPMQQVIDEQPKKEKKQKRKKLQRRKKPSSGKKKGAVNGVISLSLRLSTAICYFASGEPYDISLSHGILYTEVYNSVWIVVDAMNKCDGLSFSFPDDHAKQREIASNFQHKSRVRFGICCGCIDGMLLWIKQPNSIDTEIAKVGAGKFFCGCKKKFGLLFQGVCDADRRFLDVCLSHPASTSDYLGFCTSHLKNRIEEPDFLSEGLCLFGDLAYVNNEYMVTPFKGATCGIQDDFNFYQSQLWITVECCFGMFVNRWGVL
jgi:hypothetical protein